MRGKRGCSLRIAFCLQVAGFVALLAGCLTPYWSRTVDSDGNTVAFEGLLTAYVPGNDWTLRDFNQLKAAESDTTFLYLTLSISFGLATIFLQLFVVQAMALAVYNKSCGHGYNPDWFLVFTFLSGTMAVTSLILFEQYTGRSLQDSTDVKLDFSRGFVIIFVAAEFLSLFFIVCDRKGDKN